MEVMDDFSIEPCRTSAEPIPFVVIEIYGELAMVWMVDDDRVGCRRGGCHFLDGTLQPAELLNGYQYTPGHEPKGGMRRPFG